MKSFDSNEFPEVTTRVYRDMITNDWNLPEGVIQDLQHYFLRTIISSDLKDRVSDGQLTVFPVTYSITWIDTPESVYNHGVALCSFRLCKRLQKGYVLIKRLKQNNRTNNFKELI